MSGKFSARCRANLRERPGLRVGDRPQHHLITLFLDQHLRPRKPETRRQPHRLTPSMLKKLRRDHSHVLYRYPRKAQKDSPVCPFNNCSFLQKNCSLELAFRPLPCYIKSQIHTLVPMHPRQTIKVHGLPTNSIQRAKGPSGFKVGQDRRACRRLEWWVGVKASADHSSCIWGSVAAQDRRACRVSSSAPSPPTAPLPMGTNGDRNPHAQSIDHQRLNPENPHHGDKIKSHPHLPMKPSLETKLRAAVEACSKGDLGAPAAEVFARLRQNAANRQVHNDLRLQSSPKIHISSPKNPHPNTFIINALTPKIPR